VNPIIRYDDFQVVTPQRMFGFRSVDGIVKEHDAGDAISLKQPMIVAL
jgi:hypothetical protein